MVSSYVLPFVRVNLYVRISPSYEETSHIGLEKGWTHSLQNTDGAEDLVFYAVVPQQ